MVRTIPRLAAVASLFIASLAITPTTAAWAASACSSPQEKTFSLPGKPDVWVGAEMCIYTRGTGNNQKTGMLSINWSGSFLGGKRFDKFVAEVRVERNDIIYGNELCDWTSDLNSITDSEGVMWDCYAYYNSSLNGGWTADGRIIYNINNDGKGDYVWNLTGSPRVAIAPDGTETLEPSAEAPSVEEAPDDPTS
ncbi:hypothetical protein [Nonomuraea sp. NPDC050643]|uniref:hypothetical protein n=1 Tax=Nonomuraea sp. NPDC050643 TaxID=3155660 RepID=UPI0033CFBEA8